MLNADKEIARPPAWHRSFQALARRGSVLSIEASVAATASIPATAASAASTRSIASARAVAATRAVASARSVAAIRAVAAVSPIAFARIGAGFGIADRRNRIADRLSNRRNGVADRFAYAAHGLADRAHVSQAAISQAAIAQAQGAKSEIAQAEITEAKVSKTEVSKTEIAKPKSVKPEIAQISLAAKGGADIMAQRGLDCRGELRLKAADGAGADAVTAGQPGNAGNNAHFLISSPSSYFLHVTESQKRSPSIRNIGWCDNREDFLKLICHDGRSRRPA
jgi:hypothetical protein